MKKILFLIAFFVISNLADCESIIPFSKWPQAKPKLFGTITVVVAENFYLACQGFCNASSDDFNRIIIWFPDIYGGTQFVNTNPGYGTVNRDIQIVFLDKNWRVLDVKTMKKKTGTATAPDETNSAIEGSIGNIRRLKFKIGQPSPIRIEKIENEYIITKNYRK